MRLLHLLCLRSTGTVLGCPRGIDCKSAVVLYLQLTPGNLHRGLCVQALVDGLEGPSPQFNVKFEEPSSWRCGDCLHLRLLLRLLTGGLDSGFSTIAASNTRHISRFVLLLISTGALRGTVFLPSWALGAGRLLYPAGSPLSPVHYCSQVYIQDITPVVTFGCFEGLLVHVREPQISPDESLMHIPLVAGWGRVSAGVTATSLVHQVDIPIAHGQFTLRVGHRWICKFWVGLGVWISLQLHRDLKFGSLWFPGHPCHALTSQHEDPRGGYLQRPLGDAVLRWRPLTTPGGMGRFHPMWRAGRGKLTVRETNTSPVHPRWCWS